MFVITRKWYSLINNEKHSIQFVVNIKTIKLIF